MKRIFLIVGTPGVGKSSVSTRFAARLNGSHINVGELVKKEGLNLGIDEERRALIADEKQVSVRVREIIEQCESDVVIDGHFAMNIIAANDIYLAFILRRDPDELREVLENRGFDDGKVAENVAAEILDVCLFDVVEASGFDASLRPNQIIAVALDFTMLDNAKRESVVDAVRRELVTPYGLRTLAQSDLWYKGMYVGDRRSRDRAYHNGTVWPWLLGPYVTACRKAKSNSDYDLKHRLTSLLTQQITQAGLGTISEIFDGDPPHRPRGCIAQAWSIAEPLRAYMEDVMWIKPKYEKEVLQA